MNWHDAFAWSCLVLLGLMGGGLTWETMHWLASFPGLWHASYLILYRQAPIAAMLLTFILLAENLRATVDYWPSVGRSLADIPMAEAA